VLVDGEDCDTIMADTHVRHHDLTRTNLGPLRAAFALANVGISRQGFNCADTAGDRTMKLKLSEADRKRFWSRVNRKGKNECWEWMAGKTGFGYGEIWIQGKEWNSHRLCYFVEVGDPGKLNVLHKCDNPSCVNPAHLYAGTQAQNMRDAFIRNRRCRDPEIYHSTKLTRADAKKIRQLVAGGMTRAEAGRRFCVTASVISLLVAGKIWNCEGAY